MKKHQKNLKIKKSRNISDIGSKVNSDIKLSRTSILLQYIFEYGVNFEERVINVTGEIDSDKFDLIDFALTEMENHNHSTVTIKINSHGGDAYQALAIVGRLKKSKCHIVTEGYGQIMSAATIILACGDRRKMSKYGFFMWHENSYELEGKHSEIKAEVLQNDREEKLWANTMAHFSKKDSSFWLKNGVGKNAYFTADNLLKMGVVDEIF
jgi:ATP-dependent protease ClpP protease subunit